MFVRRDRRQQIEKRTMGMFDQIHCEVPLPDGFTGEMQTKDFDCVLGTLLIRTDGRLMIEECDWEDVPPEDRPNSLFSLLGSRRAINKRWRDLDFHGDFRFYGSEEVGGEWHEYAARFTYGALVSIDAVSKEAYPRFEALAKEKKAQHTVATTSPNADRRITKARDELTPGRRLDEILAALPEDRRREMERRAAELIAEAATQLDDYGAKLVARKGSVNAVSIPKVDLGES